jgi:hypothetical protein
VTRRARAQEKTRAVSRAEGRGSALLWFGVLGGPAAWSVEIIVGYGVEEIACSAGSASEEIEGVGVEPIIVLLTIFLGAVAAAAGLLAFGCLRRLRASREGAAGGRAEWMAIAGIATSAIFLVLILVNLFSVVYLGVCEVSA